MFWRYFDLLDISFVATIFNMVYFFVIPVVNLWTMYSTAQRFGGYDAVSITMLFVRFQEG